MKSSFFQHLWVKTRVERLSDFSAGSHRRVLALRRSKRRRLSLEGLEDRTLLSTIQWDAVDYPTGGAWDTPGHWIGGVLPTATDNVQIELPGSGTVTTGASDSVLSLTTSTTTTVSVSNGSLTLGAATSQIGGPITVSSSGTLALSGTTLIGTGTVTDAGQLDATNTTLGLTSTTMSSGSALATNGVTIQPGATLAVGANVPVTLAAATAANTLTTLADNGTLSFAAGDTVRFASTPPPNYYYGSQIVVGSGGTLQASGTTFIASNSSAIAYTQIVVNSGGTLQASGSTFALGQLNFNIGSVVAAGDLSGNAFNLPLYIPAIDVQYLSGTSSTNLQFQAIYIQPDTLTNGQSVALNLIGSQNTSNLYYVFPGNFTINQGASLSVGINVPVTIAEATAANTLTTLADNGTLNFASGDTVHFASTPPPNYYYGSQIVVGSGGTLQASGTTFNASNSSAIAYTQIVVSSGGTLQASGSTFALGQLNFNIGSVVAAGYLSGNAFNLPLYIPAIDVQYLSGTSSTNLQFQAIYIQPDTLTNGQSVALNLIGSQNTSNLYYVFPGNFTINQGASLSVGINVPVTIAAATAANTLTTLADNGTLSFASGDTVHFASTPPPNYYYGSQIVVGSGGTLQASGTTFNASNSSAIAYTQIVVSSGGTLQASGSTFALGQLNFNIGSVVAAGYLSGNAFNLPLYIPAIDVQYLSGTSSTNLQFQAIYIQPDTLTSGQSVALNLIGSQNTSNLYYVFPGNFTINQGASLSVGSNVPVTIAEATAANTLTTLADNGTLSFAAGDTVHFASTPPPNYYYGSQIVVGSGGTLQASGTTFIASNSSAIAYTQIVVNSGGTLQASGSTFALGQLNFNVGSVVAAGYLSGNAFNLPLYIPAIDVQFLSGTSSTNLQFQAIYIQPDTLTSGQSVALNLIGSQNTSNLYYVFPGNFTINQGASMSIGPNVPVTLAAATAANTLTTLADNGTLTFASGDTVHFASTPPPNYYYGSQIVVGSGGTLQASGTTFIASNSSAIAYTQIVVNSGGTLQASGSTFALGQLNFNVGSVVAAGYLSGNAFNLPLYIPAIDVQYLSGTSSTNLQFQAIYIQPDTLTSGQSVALNLIGSQNTSNLYYVFPGNFTINQGASMSVGPNVPVTIAAATAANTLTTLADNGTLSFAAGDTVHFASTPPPNYYYGSQIVVGSGGTLQASGTTFIASNSSAIAYTQIVVNSGGQFVASVSSIALGGVTLNTSTTDTLSSVSFSGVLTISSGSTLSIHGNDFSNVGSDGIVAVGDPTATIDLTANYWGTSNSTQIQAKILDHFVDPTTRPTVDYGSFLSNSPLAVSIIGTVFNDVNGDGVQDNGELGLGGVTVYLDLNNSGSLVSSDPSTVTNTLGQYSFTGEPAGTYVVRELAPNGTVQTAPPASAVSTTIDFDGTGGESGITGAGVSSFTYQGASFSGGTIFAPSQTALLASGTLAYNASSTPAEVDFNRPVTSANFFYVAGYGYAAGTATAYAVDGSVVATANTNAATTMGAPGNFVTLTGSKPIARITFVGGVVDNFTFVTAANNQAYYVKLAAGQTSNGNIFGDQYVPGALEVNSLTPTPTGFVATFNAAVNPSVLNLYDSGGQYGAPDLTLVGATTGTVRGSMVLNSNDTGFTFIQTSGLLAADTYTLTLISGANAFETATGGLLDGNGDGVPGDNYVTTFTVSPLPSNAVVVSIPDFTRGYGQTVDVPASATTGLPINLSTGLNVSSVTFTLTYNPTLLTLSDGVFSTPISGAVGTFHVTTPGTAVLTVNSPNGTQFSSTAGPITLGYLTAVVPTNAPYAAKEILHISNLFVFDASAATLPLPAVAQDAIHIAAYFGDTYGGQKYTTQDVTLEQRDIALVNSGFAAYRMADPVLIGDITGNGLIQANDTTNIQRVIALQSVPNIPALPSGLPTVATGPDPEIYIPNVEGSPGTDVSVPVYLNVTEPAGISISSFEIVIQFDPSNFTVNTATIGSEFSILGNPTVLTPSGLPNTIVVQGGSASGTGIIPYGTNAPLFVLTFQVAANAAIGTTPINLMNDVSNANGDVQTLVFANDANLSQLVLSPAPTNASNDVVDGIFGINTKVLSSISVTPANPSVAKGTTPQFDAIGTYTDGSTADLTNQVTWASATPSVATISNSGGSQGLATTLATGSTVITATLGNVVSPDDTLTVGQAVLQSIAVTPANPSVAKGLTEPFTAQGTYSDGTTANLTTQVTWASATTSVATISNTTGSQGLASPHAQKRPATLRFSGRGHREGPLPQLIALPSRRPRTLRSGPRWNMGLHENSSIL